MSNRYSHMFTLAFEVESNCEDASDVTESMLVDMVIDRAMSGELVDACGGPDDTMELSE